MGVNLTGWPFLQAGIGQHLRLVARALRDSKVPFVVNDVLAQCFSDMSLFQNDNEELAEYHRDLPIHPISIHCLNLNHLDRYADEYWSAKYNIAYGYYELSELLDEWVRFQDHVDEVWAPTTFIQSSLSRKLSIPVVHMPVPIVAPTSLKDVRKKFGLHRADFIFMTSLDLRSLVERKNPLASIRAFGTAMKQLTSNCMMVVKVSMTRGDATQEKILHSINKAVGRSKQIKIITEMLPREEFEGLLAHTNCYVSLHRAEGLGLGMAEAMAMGKPVIATDYSGNRDFMHAGNSMPVSYTLVPDPTPGKVHPGYDPQQIFYYAEPSIEHAAELMRALYLNRTLQKRISQQARESMANGYSLAQVGSLYRHRLDLIGANIGLDQTDTNLYVA